MTRSKAIVAELQRTHEFEPFFNRFSFEVVTPGQPVFAMA